MLSSRILATAALAAASLVLSATAASAALVAHADVNGLGAFEDTDTGLVWLKLNDFFGATPDDMVAAATAAGFALADQGDVIAFTASHPVSDDASWDAVEAIVGGSPSRQLMWAIWGPETFNGRYGYTYAFRGDSAWSQFPDVTPHDVVETGKDQNIWAFRSAGTGGIPEPTAWMLMIGGFGIGGAVLRRRRVAAGA